MSVIETSSADPTRPTVVMLPGLAADEGLFGALDLPGLKVRHPRWITPASPDENLRDYAGRYGRWLVEEFPNEQLHVCGMSFGGLVAFEIARQLPGVKKALLIAAPVLRSQTTVQFRGLELLLRTLPDAAVRHGLRTVGISRLKCLESLESEHVHTLDEMVKRSDMGFFRWATRACATWDGGVDALASLSDDLMMKISCLQGQHDHVIPPILDEHTILTTVPEGKHLINFTHPRQVSQWIMQCVSQRF